MCHVILNKLNFKCLLYQLQIHSIIKFCDQITLYCINLFVVRYIVSICLL